MKISINVSRYSLTKTVIIGSTTFIEKYFVDKNDNVFLQGELISQQMMKLGNAGVQLASYYETLVGSSAENDPANMIKLSRLINEFDYDIEGDRPLSLLINKE